MTEQSGVVDAFLAKLDAFAAGLEPHEQEVLAELLVGDSGEVVGFGQPPGWPGAGILIGDVRVGGLGAQIDIFLSSGHTTGSNATKPGG